MLEAGYLYWSEHIKDCKFLQNNWYFRRAMKHGNGNGKKKHMKRKQMCRSGKGTFKS